MEWHGEGLIIGTRRHGETSLIVEAMVAGRGRHLGLVRGGRSRRHAATLQPGNTVTLSWRARLDEHLGTYQIELLTPRAANLIDNRLRLYAFQLLADHLRLLPERDPYDRLLGQTLAILDGPDTARDLGAGLARFELAILEELGFGLDLYACAVTGKTEGLTHVSPKTGRAVTADIAAPYAGKLLRLPPFLVDRGEPSAADIRDGFALTGHFMAEHLWMPRNIEVPATRDRLIAALDPL